MADEQRLTLLLPKETRERLFDLELELSRRLRHRVKMVDLLRLAVESLLEARPEETVSRLQALRRGRLEAAKETGNED